MTPTFNEWKMRWSWSSGATSCFSVYFFLWFYFSVCLRKSNTNSTCTTCIYSVSETWMWMQSNSLEIIFVLCGTIYNEYIFLYIVRNKFVSQQKLNALNHIATQRLCVCVSVFQVSLLREVSFFSIFWLSVSVLLFIWNQSCSLTIWGNEILTSYVRAKFFELINVFLFSLNIFNLIRPVRSNCLMVFNIKSDRWWWMQNESNHWKWTAK